MKKTLVIILSILLFAAAVFGIWKYACHRASVSDTLPGNTIVNGVDCSGISKDEAVRKLTDKWNSKDFEIVDGGGTLVVLPMADTVYNIDGKLDSAVKDAGFLKGVAHIFGSSYDIEFPMRVEKTTKKFKRILKDFVAAQNVGKPETKDAYVDLSTTDFNVVPEVYGENIDRKVLKKSVLKHISRGNMQLEFTASDFYEQPDIKSDSEEISHILDYCNTYLTRKITYTFGSQTETLTPEQINRMIYLDDEGNITTDKEAVQEYVAELAYKYNTCSSTRVFDSTARGKVNVYGGNYGYLINQKSEAKQLTKDLKSGKDITREPVYAQKGAGRNGNDDIPNTYVEVDLTKQHMWYYKNGSLVVDAPFVSGCIKEKTGTIVGTYSLQYKERNATLRGGSEEDGTDYESEVSFWMPFFNGYGLHDATWRDEFGGTIYKTNGSHGCINLPYSKAEILFNNISAGCTIIVFY